MRLERREWLGGFAGGAAAFGFHQLVGRSNAVASTRAVGSAPFQRCLILWMEGGPSQFDTFDPKPGGPRGSLVTDLDNVRIADSLPGLASRVEDLCLIRTVGSTEGEHSRATELLHTGFTPVPTFPRPSLGSMISHDHGGNQFPSYVTLGGVGFGPAFLGVNHGPFVIDDLGSAHRQFEQIASKRRAVDLLNQLNRSHARDVHASGISSRANAIEAVGKLLDTKFPKALDIEQISTDERDRYGKQQFGQRLLAAKRLLHLGVPFVEVQLQGWDTHIDNHARTNALCRQFEQPFLALIDDLKQMGLWQDTLVIWMGEFGRTPRINARNGRDHFPEVTPVVLAGGRLGGRVIGETSEDGTKRIASRHTVADLLATVLTLMGLDIQQNYTTDFGSPTTMTDAGQPIADVVDPS